MEVFKVPVDLPKSILHQLLTRYNTQRELLTVDEQGLCQRICVCVLCSYIWVRRLRKIPRRCPSCHKPGWNMPLVAMLQNQMGTTYQGEVIPQKQLEANFDQPKASP